jgi:hypothetical protein
MIHPSWGLSPVNLRDIKLVNPWIDYDARVRPGLTSNGIKWNKVLCLGLATIVSASIWTGLVLAVARIWK